MFTALGISIGQCGQAVLRSTLIFRAPLQTNILTTRGAGTPTYTRASTATVVDFEGVVRLCKSGEARMQGWRRVENLLASSQAFNNANWTKRGACTLTDNSRLAPDGTMTGCLVAGLAGSGASDFYNTNYNNANLGPANGPCLPSFHIFPVSTSGTVRCQHPNAAGFGIIQVDLSLLTQGAWTRLYPGHPAVTTLNAFVFTSTGQAGVQFFATAGAPVSFYLWGTQLENVTGQSDQRPAEYISTGVLSYPFHGVGVDGVKYFETKLDGSSIPKTATSGYFIDFEGVVRLCKSGEARMQGWRRVENRLAASEDLTNAAWGKSNITPTFGATDPNGGATAWTLTATSSGGNILQTIATLSGASSLSHLWIRRRTGSGGVNIARADSQTWVPVAATTTWQQVSNLYTSTSNAATGIQLLSAGDAVDIWHPQLENVTGQSDQRPAEYISTGVLSYPFHGVGVDGVKYFETKLDGSIIPKTATSGYLNEPQMTNLLLNSDVPVTQNITTTAAQHTISMWGTGTCTLSGTATGTLTGTGAGNRVQLTVTPTAGTLTLTFAGSNTKGQAELGASASSYIPTTTAAAVRTADSLAMPVAANASQGTMVVTLSASGADASGRFPKISLCDGTLNNAFSIQTDATLSGLSLVAKSNNAITLNQQVQAAPTPNAQYRIAFSWNSAGRIAWSVNGGTVGSATATLPLALNQITTAAPADYPWFGTVPGLQVYSQALSDATLRALTA